MKSHFHHRVGALLATALIIAGCGGSGGGSESSAQPPTAGPPPPPPAPPPEPPPAPPPTPEPTSFTSFVRDQLMQAEAAPEAASVNEQEWVIDDEETSFDDLLGAAETG